MASALKTLRRDGALAFSAARGRLLALTPRAPHFVGAHPDHASALAAVPPGALAGYDNDAVVEVAFASMCTVKVWDYPVILWLDRLKRPGLRLLDAGGHMGTKHIAFAPLLDVAAFQWTVYDLPAIVRAARARQAAGRLPDALRFESDLAAVGGVDMLLASGLLQYLDVPFAAFLDRLQGKPAHIVLNKVATREGTSVTTLEKIGAARVPYQIRDRAGFEAEIARAGYTIRDQWEIPSLSHIIATHPALGPSTSRGYVLERA